MVDAAHPLGVEPGQVVVDGDEVDALAAEPVEVRRQRPDEGLALAGLHLGDPAEVQRRAAHQLDVEVTLADDARRGLAHDGERLDQQVVEALAAVDAAAELGGLGLQRVVGQLGRRLGEGVDVRHQALQRLELLAFAGAEDAIEDAHAGIEPTAAPAASRGRPPPACRRSPAACRGVVDARRPARCTTCARAGVAANATGRTWPMPAPSSARSAATSVLPVVTTSSTSSTRSAARGCASAERGPAAEALRPVAPGLRRAVAAMQETAARHAEHARHLAGEQLRLIEPPLAQARRAGGRPGDHVEPLAGCVEPQPADQEPGEVRGDRAPVAVLEAEHRAAGDAVERQRCVRPAGGADRGTGREREPAGAAQRRPGLVAGGAALREGEGDGGDELGERHASSLRAGCDRVRRAARSRAQRPPRSRLRPPGRSAHVGYGPGPSVPDLPPLAAHRVRTGVVRT